MTGQVQKLHLRSGEYERNVDALKEECKLKKPNSKTVCHLMKATFQGVNMWDSDIN